VFSLESLALFNVGHPLLLLMLSNTTRVQIWSENGCFGGEQICPRRLWATVWAAHISKLRRGTKLLLVGARSVSLGLSGGEAFGEMLAFGARIFLHIA
jgi:hypothetical protein